MNYQEYNLGQGSPRVTIVGGVHGDEALGKKVIDELRKTKPIKGTLTLLVAHPAALAQNKRFFAYDLNRSFPGQKKGAGERGLAYKIHQRLREADIVLDIHTTNAAIPSLAIVTRFDAKTKELLKKIPVTCVALIRKRVFGGHELIAHHAVAVSLDYGPKKNNAALKRVLRDVQSVLKNLGMINGRAHTYLKKDLYIVTEQYHVPSAFKYSRRIHELQIIRRGEVIGHNGRQEIRARYSFQPLFLHDGRYEGTFALAAKSKKEVFL